MLTLLSFLSLHRFGRNGGSSFPLLFLVLVDLEKSGDILLPLAKKLISAGADVNAAMT